MLKRQITFCEIKTTLRTLQYLDEYDWNIPEWGFFHIDNIEMKEFISQFKNLYDYMNKKRHFYFDLEKDNDNE